MSFIFLFQMIEQQTQTTRDTLDVILSYLTITYIKINIREKHMLSLHDTK